MKRKTIKTCCFSLVAALFAVSQSDAQTLPDYQAAVTNQGPTHYFKLDASLSSAVSAVTLIPNIGHAGGYTYDLYGNSPNSYFFDASTDKLDAFNPLLNGGGTASTSATAKGAVTLLFRSLAGINTGQRFLFSAGQTTSNANAFAVFVENDNIANGDPNSLKFRFGNGTTTILDASNMVLNAWYYLAVNYDEATTNNSATWYVGPAGGTLSSGTTSNSSDSVAGEGINMFIGNRTEVAATSSFRNPGSGRLDEIAIWHRMLTTNEIQSQFATLPEAASGVTVTNVIVDDSFADGDRTSTGPLQADWWSSSQTNGNSIEIYTNELGLITGTSGRGIHGTFAPQTLQIGDTIRATYTFTTPATVGTSRSTAFKVAIGDFNDPGLAADLLSGSCCVNPLYTNLPAYMVDHDVNTGPGADQTFRKHNAPNTIGRYMGTTSEWTAMGNTGTDFGYSFLPNEEYHGVIAVTRTDFDEMAVHAELNHAGTNLSNIDRADPADVVNNYGMLGIWVNSNTFGSTNAPGQGVDNGLTFSNIKVEVVTVEAITPALNIASAGSDVLLSWLTAGADGFQLQSAASLTSPTWLSNGPPPVVVGDSYVVTNSATGSEKYYRLEKP